MYFIANTFDTNFIVTSARNIKKYIWVQCESNVDYFHNKTVIYTNLSAMTPVVSSNSPERWRRPANYLFTNSLIDFLESFNKMQLQYNTNITIKVCWQNLYLSRRLPIPKSLALTCEWDLLTMSPGKAPWLPKPLAVPTKD